MDGVLCIDLAAPVPADEQRAMRRRGPAAGLRGFFLGPENELLRVAVDVVLRGDASLCPIVLYGASGTGKTHLALGLARAFALSHPRSHVLYLSASDLAYGYTSEDHPEGEGIQRPEAQAADFLVVENIHQMSDSVRSQNRLVHLIDDVSQGGGVVLLTARASQRSFGSLLPPLRSRLASGLCVSLSLPGETTRRALLVQLAADLEIQLDEEAADLLAAGLPLSVPQLRGLLVSLAYSNPANARAVTAAMARDLLKRRASAPRAALRTVAAKTARQFGLKLADLKSSSRLRDVVNARSVAILLARRHSGKSLQQIGRYFGGRDHTTVLYNCRRAESLLATDPATRCTAAAVEEHLAKTPDHADTWGKDVPSLSACCPQDSNRHYPS